MRAVVKHRIRGDGRIWVDRVRTKVLKATGGWYAVASPSGAQDARVLYRTVQDLVVIEQNGRFLRIPFRAGEAAFDWDGRPYHIGTMVKGDLGVDQGGRPVARGAVMVSGVRFDEVATELLPLIRPLAWSLALRSEELDRDSFRGGVPG